MGLFDFLKKTSSQSKATLNLEELLKKAATEPPYRAEFYRRLLTDELIVITKKTFEGQGNYYLNRGATVNIRSLPDGKLPVFTSADRIFDNGATREEVNFITLQGRDLFELAKRATFILNPYSDYGKDLLPGEIENILNGKDVNSPRQIVIKKETPVRIGQPAVYPTDIINLLKVLFSKKPNIKAAYVAWIHDPESGDPPHYIFAIDGEGDQQSLTQDAGLTVNQFLKGDEIVDFIKIDHNNINGLGDYFFGTQPFYRRAES